MTTATTVSQSRMSGAARVIVSSGSSAPIVNETVEASAAFQGLEMSSGSMPSSASACAPRASFLVSAIATSRASSSSRPFST